jgi:hypothetical protein
VRDVKRERHCLATLSLLEGFQEGTNGNGFSVGSEVVIGELEVRSFYMPAKFCSDSRDTQCFGDDQSMQRT